MATLSPAGPAQKGSQPVLSREMISVQHAVGAGPQPAVRSAPGAAGSLSAAEPRLPHDWQCLVPPGSFPASSNFFLSDRVNAELLVSRVQGTLLISSCSPRNLLSGWLVQAVLPDLPACDSGPPRGLLSSCLLPSYASQ